MDTSRISFGEMVAAASGLALFIIMFLPWYGVDVEGGFPGGVETPSANAWESFSFIDILLFLAAAIAIAVAVMRAMGSMPALPIPPGTLVAAAGALAVVLVLFRLIDTPGETGAVGAIVDVEITRKIGVFLGLIAAAGVAFGGYNQMNEPAGAAPPRPGGAPPPPPPTPPPASGGPPAG